MESPSEGIPQTSDAPSASVPASDAPHDCSPPCDDITLLVITLNEGILPLSSSVATSALNAALEGNTHVCGVVMARQETVDAISTASWDEALAASGFGQKLVCERKEGNDHKFNALCIYGRNADDIKVLDIFVTGAANIEKKPLNEKGGVVALMDCKGCKICFGGFHCDGNIPSDLERTAQLPAAVLRTWGRGHEADVALFVGDINCTMDPKNVDSSKESSNAQVCGELLAADIAILRASVEKKGLKELSSDLRDRLETGLANKVDRNELMKSLDSCPSVLQVERSSLRHDVLWSEMTEPEEKMAECGITELLLQEMPQGSFPTYRMTSRDDKGWNAIKEARKAESMEVQGLEANLDVPRECIRDFYFADQKAGVLKKRGDMIRLNLGWLDRLYYGVNKGSAATTLLISQGTPQVLRLADGRMLDHALVPWTVTIKKNENESQEERRTCAQGCVVN